MKLKEKQAPEVGVCPSGGRDGKQEGEKDPCRHAGQKKLGALPRLTQALVGGCSPEAFGRYLGTTASSVISLHSMPHSRRGLFLSSPVCHQTPCR